jgi:uncharacterized protein YbjT (DUF2867 family)
MNILVTGANGYIGTHLIPSLLTAGHQVHCVVRDRQRFRYDPSHHPNLHIWEANLLKANSLEVLPQDIDVAYYLVHSMGNSSGDFAQFEYRCADNFAHYIRQTRAQQVIYLSGIANDAALSKHLNSRLQVENRLKRCGVPLTVLRAAIIIGSGSASFEILRDLVEKLPFMITPKWVSTRCQPIAIADVVFYLIKVILNPQAYGESFDIGGPDALTYRDMMLGYAKLRGLKRYIVTVPVLTPQLSSLWLHFITSTNFSLARSLVDSMKNEVVCGDNHISKIIDHLCLTYETALSRALTKIENNQVLVSWRDSVVSGNIQGDCVDFVLIPEGGVVTNNQFRKITAPIEEVRQRIWSIGGKNGWYYMNWAWKLRGILDQIMGGVGLRRGRRDPHDLRIGDALDFWRVVISTEDRSRLGLFAEMKVPGEAWLEFEIFQHQGAYYFRQTATFRPRGIKGRLYWYSLVPVHFFIFGGMANAIAGKHAISEKRIGKLVGKHFA